MTSKRVLVVGGAGYVGSQLVKRMVEQDIPTRVLDTFWFGEHTLREIHPLEILKGDMRDLSVVREALSGVDTVIHLACISNDPSFDLNPSLGKSVNLDSFLPFLNECQLVGVRRFIYASSSSVYGIKREPSVTEDLTLEPLTDYSRYKAECERILLEGFSDRLVACVVRPATVCGFSSRQRFDLVVNILTASALTRGAITLMGGSQYRPNLHIEDMVDCYLSLLSSEDKKIRNQIFNVGGDNLQLSQIAESVREVVSRNIPINVTETDDLRSYRIESGKIEKVIGFVPKRSVRDAIEDLVNKFKANKFNKDLFGSDYINIKKMQELNLG
jgi:nucleoside-diphosphate-sugar epimerase